MPLHLSSDQISFFEENGYLNGIRIFSDEETAAARKSFDELEAKEGRENCVIGLQARHLDIPFIWELAINQKILDCMVDLMGDDVMLLSTHFFCKYPENRSNFVAWHQDITYWGLEPPFALTAWCAIDDSDVENGCMRGIAGSHRHGIIEHGKSAVEGNLLSINQEAKIDGFDESSAFDFILKAGEISIHHGHLLHSSNPNMSQRRRCGLTLRYVLPESRPARANSINKPWPAVIVRGEDRFNNYDAAEFQFER